MGASPESDRAAIQGYEPLHRVAQSYLGTLWIAVDKRGGGTLRLLRRLQLPEPAQEEARRGIAAAARDSARISHANVLAVVEVLEEGGLIAVAYEHLEAEPLRSLQSWANLRCLSFPVGVALRIVTDLLRGLAATHELYAGRAHPVVFGGLSPDSVLVARDGSTKLCDCLVASCASLLEPIGASTGKLAYSAPEQVHTVAPLTAPSDLFTCAAMLWELLAMRRLLAGSRPAIERKLLEHDLPSLRAHLRGDQATSQELVDLVERGLAADPAQRPQSALEMIALLAKCGHPVATLEEVAHFVGKLSGQRFDRRTAAVRSKALPELDVPLQWPIEVPASTGTKRRGARPSPEPLSQVATPRAGELAQRPVEPPRRAPAPAAPLPAFGEIDIVPPGVLPGTAVPARVDPQRPPVDTRTPVSPAAFAPFVPLPFTPAPVQRPSMQSPVQGPSAARLPLPAAASPKASAQNPAFWDTMIAQSAPPTRTPGLGASATESRTITGLGAPPHPMLAPNLPFSNLTPSPFPAASNAGRAPLPAHARSADEYPQRSSSNGISSNGISSRALLAHDMPASHPAGPTSSRSSAVSIPASAPRSGTGRRGGAFERGWAVAVGLLPRSPLYRQFWLGILAAALMLPVVLFLLDGRRRATVTGSAAAPAATAPKLEAAPAREAPGVAPEPVPASPRPEVGPVTGPAPSAATLPAGEPQAPASTPPEPPAPEPPSAPEPSFDFSSPTLDDSQLVELFALERRSELPSCAERLGEALGEYSGKDPKQSLLQLKAARREMLRGDAVSAHGFLCGATAHDPGNASAQHTLAELALQLGDPVQAKASVERALERSPKDPTLLATLGDALALLGDIAGSRAVWLRTLPKGSEAERTRRLSSSYRRMGDRALAGSSFAQACAYFRRSLILSQGSVAPSLGLSEALIWLNRDRAALAWSQRAARAFPKDSRVQVLYGDALFETGQVEKARAAWQVALDIQPNHRIAARRLREGRP